MTSCSRCCFFFQAEDGIRDLTVTGVQTCALPIFWARNAKFAMLPKEAEYAHPRGWPAKPNDAVRRIENNYVLPDMVAKAIHGMPTRRAMEWAQEQVVQATRGQLKPAS